MISLAQKRFFSRIWNIIFECRDFLIENNPVHLLALSRKLKGYNTAKALADLKAGTNVALLAFPQAMAYAVIAGLPVEYGLYAAAIAPVVAAVFASSRFTMVGPSNATAVMVLGVFLGMPPGMERVACLSLLVCMVGVFLVIGAFLRVAVVTQYISRSVLIGYITGAALLIVANQVHHVLGFTQGESATFLNIIRDTFFSIGKTDWPTLTLAVATLVIYVFVAKFLPRLPQVMVALIVCAGIGALISAHGHPLLMVKAIPPGSWDFTPPNLRLDWLRQLAGGALALAFLASLENTFMGKMLANRSGESIDVNQEMFALGAANLSVGLFAGMPVSGSLSRSSLNWSSGAVSPMAAVFSGTLCAISAPTVGRLIHYVPQASLGMIVIITAFGLIDLQTIRFAFRSTKSDAAVLIVTLLAALVVPLHIAIFMGVILSVALFMHKASRPQLVEYAFNNQGLLAQKGDGDVRNDPQISIVHVEGELFFGAADLFRDQLRRVCSDSQLRVIILRLKNARHLDATNVMSFADLIKSLRKSNRHLIVSGATHDVYRVFRNSGLLTFLGRENFFMAVPSNPTLSTRNALLRATELIGHPSPPIRLFYGEERSAASARV